MTFGLASTAAQNTRGAGTDRILVGQGVENLEGGSGADRLTGDAGANRLMGGGGNDTLVGGLGADTLAGAADNDVFVFNAALGGTNVDTIEDFVVGQDLIQLENNGVFTALTATGALADGAFNTGPVASQNDDRIVFDTCNGRLWYGPDGSGSMGAVHFATLTGLSGSLTAAQFRVI